MKMFHRMVNPRRVLMVLASFRRTLNPQDYTIFTNTYPQSRQVRTLPQVFKPRNYSSVTEAKVEEANQVLSLLQAKDWCNETEEKLNCLTDISVDHVVSALKNLDPVKALSFFTWYNKHPSYKPSSPVYNAMLRAVGKKTHIAKFWELTEEMKSHGFSMESHTYSLVSSRLWKSRMSEDMANLLIWMFENGEEKPGVVDCFNVLQCLSQYKTPDADAAYRVIDAFKSSGQKMQKIVYDILHRCLTKAGRFEEAEKVVESMTNEGFTPDIIIYKHTLQGLCRANRPDKALKIFHEVKEKGYNIDLKTWEIIIAGHYKADEMDKALALLAEMEESGCTPDAYIIKGLAVHLCHKKRGMDAYNLLCKSIEQHKIKPSDDTYSEVIDKLSQSGMLNVACKVFDLMKEHGHVPQHCIPLVQPIIDALGKSVSVDDAFSFVSKIKKDRIYGKACIAMVDAFWKESRHSEAHDLVSRLPYIIAKSPEILKITKRTSTDKTTIEDSTENSQNVNISQNEKVTKKGEQIKGLHQNGFNQ